MTPFYAAHTRHTDGLVNRLWRLDNHPESAPRQAFDRIEYLEAALQAADEAIEDALGRHQVTHIHAALAAYRKARGGET